MYQAVILDVDGTLVDSNDAHAHAWVDALAEHGRIVTFSRVRPLIGIGSDKVLATLTSLDPESPEAQAIVERRREIFERRYIDALRPTRGAHRLLEALRDEGKQLVVASSAQAGELHDLLRVADATKLVDESPSRSGTGESKPDPDIVRAALARTNCPAHEAIMIGDTPYDVQAAARAGIGIIALRCGGWPDHALKGALAIYDDPEDLLEHYALSPFKHPLPIGQD